MSSYRSVLAAVQRGELSIEDGLAALRKLDTEDLGFATLDHQRTRRRGFPEVVYCEGKTVEQSAAILEALAARADGNVIGTRASTGVYELVRRNIPDAEYHDIPRLLLIRRGLQTAVGHVAIAAAGTSDLPVAEEAALTAEALGARVTRIYDVGVAGLQRLMHRLDELRAARVIVAVAGMEGALVTVLAGLVEQPVIAVPTSVGYGAQLNGFAALLGMLTNCVPGIGVVNIDNGFGAGYLAAQINRLGETT